MIFRCFFSSKYIDSRLFWSSLELLDKLYELRQQPFYEQSQQSAYERPQVQLLKDLFNIQKDWNVSIVYHPSYLEIYRHAQSYLNLIKEALGANDLFSLFAYNRDKLKKVISTQKISNLNFEESLSTYSCNDTLLRKRYSFNLFERMDKYIKFKSQKKPLGNFNNKQYRNLLQLIKSNWQNKIIFNCTETIKKFNHPESILHVFNIFQLVMAFNQTELHPLMRHCMFLLDMVMVYL